MQKLCKVKDMCVKWKCVIYLMWNVQSKVKIFKSSLKGSEAINELIMSKEMEQAAQENLLTVMEVQLLRDQISQQEFFFKNQFKSIF